MLITLAKLYVAKAENGDNDILITKTIISVRLMYPKAFTNRIQNEIENILCTSNWND